MIVKNDIWINSEMCLFWFPPGAERPEYIPCTAVMGLYWDTATDNRDLVCLEAQLPTGRRVLDLEDGGTLELVSAMCGPRDDYSCKDSIAFRASLCINQSRKVREPIVNSPELDVIVAEVDLSCCLEILPDE